MTKRRNNRKARRRRNGDGRRRFIELTRQVGKPRVSGILEAYAKLNRVGLSDLWQLGKVVAEILTRPCQPGERSPAEFIRSASQQIHADPPDLLFTAAKLYRIWPDADEFQAVINMRGEFGFHLNSSHLMLIGQVAGQDERRAVAARTIDNLWNKHKLHAWLTNHFGRAFVLDELDLPWN